MDRKGLLVEVPSLWIIGIGLVFFTLLFAFMGFLLNPAQGSIKEADSLASASRVSIFLEMNAKFNDGKITTLNLLDDYCSNKENSELKKKQLDEMLRRSRMMFDNMFVSLGFECQDGERIHLRDYVCNEPKVFPIINKDNSISKLYFCDNPDKIITNDGKEWARSNQWRNRLVELNNNNQPTMSLINFRRLYAYAG